MDPYLEHPALWPGVHNRVISALDEDLSPRLLPRYYVEVQERVYVAEGAEDRFVGVPDAAIIAATPTQPERESATSLSAQAVTRGAHVLVAELPVPESVRETYLEVRDTQSGEVLTVVEVLSPANKRGGSGRTAYELKRNQVLASLTNLVEVDLLRAGAPPPMRLPGLPNHDTPPGDYRILVARGRRRPLAEVYPFAVTEPIPTVPLPLRDTDEVPLDLQAALQRIYERAGYALRVDYRQDPVPPLRVSAAEWADVLLRRRGLR
jgi:hypothetical protein